MDTKHLEMPIKGRGAVTNRTGRFERETTNAVDDGWDLDDEDLPPLRTQVTFETPRTMISGWRASTAGACSGRVARLTRPAPQRAAAWAVINGAPAKP